MSLAHAATSRRVYNGGVAWLLTLIHSLLALFGSAEEVEVWRGVLEIGGAAGTVTLHLVRDRFNRSRLGGRYRLEGEGREQGTVLALVDGDAVLGSLCSARRELVFEGKAAPQRMSLNLVGEDGACGSLILLRR